MLNGMPLYRGDTYFENRLSYKDYLYKDDTANQGFIAVPGSSDVHVRISEILPAIQ